MQIQIRDLALWTHIGVPEEERAREQRIFATVTLGCDESASKTDAVTDTMDYEELAHHFREVAKSERKTLEKLAADLCDAALAFDKVLRVSVELTKCILPGVREVTVRMERGNPYSSI
jgi:dihydroneopterin aldolase